MKKKCKDCIFYDYTEPFGRFLCQRRPYLKINGNSESCDDEFYPKPDKKDNMKQYIDKDAVVAEIKRRIKIHHDYGHYNAEQEFTKVLSFLDNLEVKEIDFDNDLFEEVYSHLNSIKETADRMTSGNFMHNRAAIKFSANTIAKVLELIGIKAQKGE